MSTVWHLEGHNARLAGEGWSASIDLLRADDGLRLQRTPEASAASVIQSLGVSTSAQHSLAASRLDAYVRGADLVATYEEPSPRLMRMQAYWRAIDPVDMASKFAEGIVAGFDLILSVNTSLLDVDPQSRVRSLVLPAAELLHVRAVDHGNLATERIEPARSGNTAAVATISRETGCTGCFLVRCQDPLPSYLEMVHPADFGRSTFTTENSPTTGGAAGQGIEIAHELFQQRLEKGVILRARIRAALVDRRHDEDCAMAVYQRFAEAEPPLTA